MKKIKIAYWIITGLFAAFMLFSSIPNVMSTPESITFITGLGYPAYFIPFIGVAKVLGVIGILIPGFPRLKEWAYAGLTFDLVGASYSLAASTGDAVNALGMLPILLFLALSYFLYHRLRKTQVAEADSNVQFA